MNWNFPEIKSFRSYGAQLDKIQEELDEAREALENEGEQRFIEESLDVLQSVETLLRNVDKRNRLMLMVEVAIVKIKNFKRGYYDD